MKVLLITRNFVYYTSQLANGLAEAGTESHLLYPEDGGDLVLDPGQTTDALLDEMLRPDVHRSPVSIPRGSSSKDLVPGWLAVRRAIKAGKRFQPDVIHVQQMRDWRLYLAVRRLSRTAPIVLTMHDAVAHPGEPWDKKSLFVRKYLGRVARRVIVHGEFVGKQLAESGFETNRIRIVPHGAYTLYEKWSEPGIEPDGRSILFYGRMQRYKGMEQLMLAMPLVQEKIPDARLVVAGSGPDLDARVEQLSRMRNVQVIPRRILNQETARLFQEAAVVVLPYVEASQSGVVNIAYAFGKPVVATSVGALPEVIKHGETGLLVPPGDPKALADALVRLLEDSALWTTCSDGARRMAEGPLSWTALANQTLEVYREARLEFGGR